MVIIVAIGLTITVRSRFVQVRYFGRMFRVISQGLGQGTQDDGISSFQALTLSVAGRVGAGNIAGVAIALSVGGPGAIFWMWLVGLMGMATSIFECSLAQLFKVVEPDGSYRGGPSYYIEQGLGQRWLGLVFALLMLVTFGLAFSTVQAYTVATSIHDSFGVPAYLTGIILTSLIGVIILGGIKRIVTATEYVVPFMAIAYFLLALFILGRHFTELPSIVSLIVKSAFGLEPAAGGTVGMAVLYGVRRGLFSNEAGLGSAPNVAAIATVKHPVSQGIVQALSVFIDTLVLCSCTAAIILVSGVDVQGAAGGVALTQVAVAQEVGAWGERFVAIALILFALTSIIYGYYLGENALNYFSDNNQALFSGFRVVTIGLVFWGTIQDLEIVLAFADLFMGILAVINLSSIIRLFNLGLGLIQDYDQCIASGQADPIFTPESFLQTVHPNDALNLDFPAWSGNPANTVDETAQQAN